MRRVLLCADRPGAVEDVRRLLEQAGDSLDGHPLGPTDPDDLSSYSLILIEGSHAPEEALACCRRLKARPTDSPTPILFLLADAAPAARQACLDSGADGYVLRPFSSVELLHGVQSLLRSRDLHHRLHEMTAETHRLAKRLHAAHQRMKREGELAQHLRKRLLPQALPAVGPVHFAVRTGPGGAVGGDFYDVFRIDEHHVGLYLADTMGHGVLASLLTSFLKSGLRAKEIEGSQYRIVPPDLALQRLNREMLDQALPEDPFITMIYLLLDCRDGTVRFARAGQPHPLYLPSDGEPRLWQAPGSLLGVFETQFSVQTHQLRPGDKVVLSSNGLGATHAIEAHPGAGGALLASASRHRALPIDEVIDHLYRELCPLAGEDDLTLLGLEMRGLGGTIGEKATKDEH
jgi:sigma-B regulation protein RsbU (phosphoserine phosphatase)